MRLILTLAISLLITNILQAQKLYIWCPKDQEAAPRKNFLKNDSIDLVIFDGRIIPEKSKVECTREETIKALTNVIRSNYPSAIFSILPADDFYQDPKRNRVTIKVGIASHHAAFGADIKVGIGSVGGNFSYGIFPEGKWNAVTSYAIKLYDYRNGAEIKRTRDIAKVASRPNTGGYITAKNILNTTYIDAYQELLQFIDDSLMK